MRAGFGPWVLLPPCILAASALVALGIIVFGPSSVGRSPEEIVARGAASEPVADCSGALSNDYACHRERYQDLVDGSGAETAFGQLKDDYGKNDFVKYNCHRLTHDIGHVAAELYGDVSRAFGHGDHFCVSGYYHGVMETLMAKMGSDKVLEDANAICTELRENQEYSDYHYGCAHGLGHGFMVLLDNELFESLEACDGLTDGWERRHCYSGVFMQNAVPEYEPSHPPKYLKADRPLYPCTDVETRYKEKCYSNQASYVLRGQGNDFTKAFEFCAEVEDGFGASCYRYLGYLGAGQSIARYITDEAQIGSSNMQCMLAEDSEGRSNCVAGAARGFVHRYRGNEQAKTFCESFDNEAELRDVCLRAAEEPFEEFFEPD